jgi:hypothetical protein
MCLVRSEDVAGGILPPHYSCKTSKLLCEATIHLNEKARAEILFDAAVYKKNAPFSFI